MVWEKLCDISGLRVSGISTVPLSALVVGCLCPAPPMFPTVPSLPEVLGGHFPS